MPSFGTVIYTAVVLGFLGLLLPPPRPLPQFDQNEFFDKIQQVSGSQHRDGSDGDGGRPAAASSGQLTFANRPPASSIPSYTQVFNGTGSGSRDRDASIGGEGYLTYKLVGNETYNVDACLDVCDSLPSCVFVNLFYEYNNNLLDFVFSEKSNLKCVAYSTVHTAKDKTNFGGQQSVPLPADKTYVQHSTGYAKTALWDPPLPEGYELVFGPEEGYIGDDGWLSTVLLDTYDVATCAVECTNLAPSTSNGVCQFFNINQVSVAGTAATTSCLLYSIPKSKSDLSSSTKDNTTFSYSRGYRRITALPDGGFESYQSCDPSSSFPSPPTSFCFTYSTPTWSCQSSANGFDDCSIIHFSPYAHTGTTVSLLGSLTNTDNHFGTLSPSSPLNATTPGGVYHLGFWHYGAYSGPELQKDAFVDVLWNFQPTMTVVPGYTPWLYFWTTVEARGDDFLLLVGGKAPAWSFVDDIVLYQL
ncbi:hypothetical protein BDN72DRAFT_871415 [Pluteus cervinus]|uniref:Uncharacterized protein n=1 Tax=Pluteus cervinus TaxID=181527 RepID=A0ACD3AN18_9AGAR|nr:hypothetical protein BDN72DRAFT_871415 [Pluteus cervinus]